MGPASTRVDQALPVTRKSALIISIRSNSSRSERSRRDKKIWSPKICKLVTPRLTIKWNKKICRPISVLSSRDCFSDFPSFLPSSSTAEWWQKSFRQSSWWVSTCLDCRCWGRVQSALCSENFRHLRVWETNWNSYLDKSLTISVDASPPTEKSTDLLDL